MKIRQNIVAMRRYFFILLKGWPRDSVRESRDAEDHAYEASNGKNRGEDDHTDNSVKDTLAGGVDGAGIAGGQPAEGANDKIDE